MRFFKSRRRLLLIGIDLAIFVGVYFLANLLVHLTMPYSALPNFYNYAINFSIILVFLFASRIALRVYSNVWRYANSRAYLETVFADVVGGIVALFVTLLLPIDVFLGGWRTVSLIALFNSATLVSRFIYQQQYKHRSAIRGSSDNKVEKINVAILGAGQVGSLLAEELSCFEGSRYVPVCFVDHNSEKIGKRVMGLPVYSEGEGIFNTLEAYGVEEVLVAIPRLDGKELADLLNSYTKAGYKVKLYDFPTREDSDKESSKRVIREFRIEDLLFRNAIKVADSETKEFYRDRVVLVTGGGGSIGSELSRQIAKCKPRKLIIFDIYENNAYDIQQELIRRYGDELDLVVEIGSVRDRARLEAVFAAYRPEIVFHAAAHKHVPLMEHSNAEAIKNNVLGTYNTADMAEKYGVHKFILISTDKAVNPTNVMGASKRMCEMVIQCRNDGATVFSAVRFGNVLGSNGSVIPLFKKQIAQGGPVTITDNRIIRYFMTIPEASGLVMNAGAMARCGELFVLDMGKPVKIYDLAENMIKLSGLRPHVDIPIIETGLRPGEKLYEELLIKTEELEKTENNMIFIERDRPLTRDEVEAKLDVLRDAVKAAEHDIASVAIAEAMKSVVPTFYSPEEVNRLAESAVEMKEALVN